MKRLALVLALLAGAATRAQEHPVSKAPNEVAREVWNALSLNAEIEDRAGSDGLLVKVSIELKNHYHLYADRLSFWTEADPLIGGQRWKIDVVRRPGTTSFLDPQTKTLKEGYSGHLVFDLVLRSPELARLPPGSTLKLPLVTQMQACSDQLCLLPVAIRLELSPTHAPAESEGGGLIESLKNMLQGRLAAGGFSLFTLLILLGAGVLTAFTPCVYPLYPLTLGIFSRWSHVTHVRPRYLVVAWCAGLTLSYAVVGLVSAASGSVFGSLTQTPAFLIAVGLLILLSAVFFSGLLNVPVPSRIMNFFTRPTDVNKRSSTLATLGHAAFMGMGLGVVAAPCVGPVLVVILAWLGTALKASQGAALQGFALLSVFGVGMSLPFLIVGHFVLDLHKRPSLGRYTGYFKHVGTLLMILAAFYFISEGTKLARARGGAAAHNFPVKRFEDWKPGKWTLLDFSAEWCAACHELDEKTFSTPEISALFRSNWDFVDIDMTEVNANNSRIASQYNVVSLPTVILVNPAGRACEAQKLFGFEEAGAFAHRLEAAQRDCP